MIKYIGFLGVCIGVFFCGCEAIEDALNMNIAPYSPKYEISLKSVVKFPRGNEIEETITDFYGKEIIVNSNEILGSSMIMKAELIPLEDEPGFYDILLTPNQTGLKIWFQLAIDKRNEPVAILIDDAYFGQFRPDDGMDEDTETVTLKGPFNEVVARGIVKFATRNYRHYHPNAGTF